MSDASRLAPDARVRQYWDGGNQLGDAFRRVLGLSGPAWDVYLLFGPEQTWTGDLPPKPLFWMHQLHDVTQAPVLDAETFSQQADRLVARQATRRR